MKTRMDYGEYKDLFPHEYTAIYYYLERHDAEPLGRVTSLDPKSHCGIKSQGMRDFISDVITRKITIPKHKKSSKALEDFDIYLKVRDLMDMSTTLNKMSKEKAIAIVASELRKSEGAIEDAYKRTRTRSF
jgi:uncharacterized protein YoaH (UPF0181 family)